MMKSILSVGNKTVKLLSTLLDVSCTNCTPLYHAVYTKIEIIAKHTLKRVKKENKIREENTYTSSSTFDCHSLPAN